MNILPLCTMKELEISIDEFKTSRLMIQGFNEEGQRALGIIRIPLLMDDMLSTALFHVIDENTSYLMLLGRPWLHENGVVPSSWHQCFKYSREGVVKTVVGDDKPFTEVESYFADAKYYLEDINTIKAKETPTHGGESQQYEKVEKKQMENISSPNGLPTCDPETLGDLILPLIRLEAAKSSPHPLKEFVYPKEQDGKKCG